MNATATPQPEIIQAKAIKLADQAFASAEAVEIDSPEMFQVAGAELQAIKTRAKEIEEMRLSITRPLDDAKRRVMDLFKVPLATLERAEGLVKNAMLTYQRAEQKKAEDARREAEAKAQAEREEAARAQREAEATAAAAREAAEAAAAAGNTEAAAKAAEEAAEAEAAAEEAQAVVELADIAPPPMPTLGKPKAAGVSTRQNWKHEVTDFAALVVAAAAAHKNGDPTLLGYLQANETAIGQVARALKAQARIPGVRIYAEDALAVRTRIA